MQTVHLIFIFNCRHIIAKFDEYGNNHYDDYDVKQINNIELLLFFY